MEFIEVEQILLKVSPMKVFMRFEEDNLSSRFIGWSVEILSCIGELVYELALSPSLAGVNPVFHLSRLLKCYEDYNWTPFSLIRI